MYNLKIVFIVTDLNKKSENNYCEIGNVKFENLILIIEWKSVLYSSILMKTRIQIEEIL